MANQQRRKRFSAAESADYTILDGSGNTYGHLRIKPSNILWKPKNARSYYNVSIEDFQDWMSTTPKARKTKS